MLAGSDVETRSLAPLIPFQDVKCYLGGGVKLSYANKPFPPPIQQCSREAGNGGRLRAGRVSSNAREGIRIALPLTGPGGRFSTAEGNCSSCHFMNWPPTDIWSHHTPAWFSLTHNPNKLSFFSLPIYTLIALKLLLILVEFALDMSLGYFVLLINSYVILNCRG
jgi:hypothetical protein